RQKNLEGQIVVSVNGTNLANSSNHLDAKPETVAIWNDTAKQFSNYENEVGVDTQAGGRDERVTFLIDNFLPFRAGVTIGDPLSPNFIDNWAPTGTPDEFTYQMNQSADIISGNTYPVQVKFSEPVKNTPTMTVSGNIGSVN